MWYRRFLQMFGEINLERKCRFIFGMVIVALITISFFWYGQRTASLVRKQTTQTARMIVGPTLMDLHYRAIGNAGFEPLMDSLGEALRAADALPRHDVRVLPPDSSADPRKPPRDEFEQSALDRFIRSAANREPGYSPERTHIFADGSPIWAERIDASSKYYHYVQAVFFKPACLMSCHRSDDGRSPIDHEPTDLAGAVVISLPMEQTNRAINGHRATMIAFAIVTAVLAMLSSHLAIRDVIVRPIQHLRGMVDERPRPDETSGDAEGSGNR